MPRQSHPHKSSRQSPISANFLFTVCQVGAEKALKEELARDYPDLKFAFSRPGFVTFKSKQPLPDDFELISVFARAYGLSLGIKITSPGMLIAEAEKIQAQLGEPLRLHIFERDQFVPGEEPKGYGPGLWENEPLGAAALAQSKSKGSLLLHSEISLKVGEPVLDVICVEEKEWWLGFHRHQAWHSSFAGGKPQIQLPPEAPSRAYLKVEEAIRWSGAPIRPGDCAVEVGSAPGGATYALLLRGVNVVGIDPGAMAPAVLGFHEGASFEHIARPVATVPREELPEQIEWFLVDMNVEPRISLAATDRLASRMKDSLLGVILTLKLNQWSFAKEIPAWQEHLKLMGMLRVRAAQLSHHRQEICVYGLTRKGMARLRD